MHNGTESGSMSDIQTIIGKEWADMLRNKLVLFIRGLHSAGP